MDENAGRFMPPKGPPRGDDASPIYRSRGELSPRVTVLPLEPEHLAMFDLELEPGRDPEETKAQVIRVAERGTWFTGFVPEGIVGIGGITPMWGGVADAWFGATPLVTRYPLSLCKVCARALARARRKNRLHRIECKVWKDHPTSHRWVEALGFEREGVLRRYGPRGDDYVMYARVF